MEKEKPDGFFDVAIKQAADLPETKRPKTKSQVSFDPVSEKGTGVPVTSGTSDLRKKSILSRFMLTILLYMVLFSVACCAVYTVVSMSSSEKNGSVKETLILEPKQLVKPEGDPNTATVIKNVKPNISFSIFFRGKPQAKEDDMPTPKDIITPVSDILKEFTNREKVDALDKETKDVAGKINDANDDSKAISVRPKPRIMKTETWTIRRIPLDGGSPQVTVIKTTTSPRSDGSSFFPSPFSRGFFSPDSIFPFDFFKKLGEERKRIDTKPKSEASRSEEDKSTFFKSPMDDFKNMFNLVDKFFEPKSQSDMSQEAKPRTFVRIIPLTRVRFFPLHERPLINDVEILPKTQKPDLDKYKAQSVESNDFLHKFLGLPKVTHEKQAVSKSESKSSGLSPLFQNWSDPFWPRLNVDIKPKYVKPSQDLKDSKMEESLSKESSETVTTEQPTSKSTTKDIVNETTPQATTVSPKSNEKDSENVISI